MNEIIKCNHCQKYKYPEEFNWRYKALGIRHPTCKECQKPFRKKWYEGDAHERHLQQVRDRKQEVRKVARTYVLAYLMTNPCTECGEDDPRVLEFHHRDEEEKYMDVSQLVAGGYSIGTIQAEINKCDVLCANCHRKKTMNERGWFRGKS
jgi:hypothetical protein